MNHANAKNTMVVARFAAPLAAMLLTASIAAQAATTLDGVWRIAHPQTQLAPADGKPIPFNAEGRKAFDENEAAAAKGDYAFDLTMSKCDSPGQPRLMVTPLPFAVYQRGSMVTIVYQWNRLFRQINIGNPLTNPIVGDGWKDFRTKQGLSEGHWEGDTLVVKTTGLSGETLLDNRLPTSDELTLTEHLRLRGENALEDRITINDPQHFTRPWDTVVTYQRQSEDLLPFREDVCLDHLQAHQSPLPK
ncbi:hypothetical protein ACV229_15480 [Burkholderia sp. MR1-5-21]